MNVPLQERAFTLLISDQPIVSFHAKNLLEARELAREEWLRADLALCQSNGRPIWNGNDKFSFRRSTQDEATRLLQATAKAGVKDEIVLAFLVELDGSKPD